jgi:hypothetical protein
VEDWPYQRPAAPVEKGHNLPEGRLEQLPAGRLPRLVLPSELLGYRPALNGRYSQSEAWK